ncbi:MAG: efflux RND transporter periplasmic adaptor subunit [Planctomycetota bacterium]
MSAMSDNLLRNLWFRIIATMSIGCLPAQVCGQADSAVVQVERVTQANVAPMQSFVATVRPHRRVSVGSAVNGRVLEFPFDAGQAVQSGDPIAQLRTKTIGIELAAAKAELRLREAELRELKNGSRKEEISLAEATRWAAETGRDYATTRLGRIKKLFQNGSGISEDEYESAAAQALQAEARVAEARSNLQLVRQGPRVERIEQAAARVGVQKQVVEGLIDRMNKYTIRSPFDGFVSMEMTDVGAWVNQGDVVAEIVELDPVEVEVFVPESSVRFLTIGDSVSVFVDAADGSFDGSVETIIPVANAASRTFPVRVTVANPKVDADRAKHLLLPGMLARVMLPAGSPTSSLLVPKDALQLGGPEPLVWKVVDQVAVSVPVSIGAAVNERIAVVPLSQQDLSIHDVVITRGNERLRSGQPVDVRRTDSVGD